MAKILVDHQLDIMLGLSCICATLAVFAMITKALPVGRRMSVLFMELSALILIYFDRLSYMFDGDTSSTGYVMARLANFMVFVFTDVCIMAFNYVMIDMYKNEGNFKTTPTLLFYVNVLAMIGVSLVVVSYFTGLYYTIDENNSYVRGPGFVISYFIPILMSGLQLIFIIQNRNRIRRKITIGFAIFILVPIIASLVQLIVRGTPITNMTIAFMTIIIFVFALTDLSIELEMARNREIVFLKDQQNSIQRLFYQTASVFMGAIESKDVYSLGHAERVAKYAKAIAQVCGKREEECNEIFYAALLHDIGKIGLPEAILKKGDDLTDEEREIFKRKTIIGDKLLSGITEYPYLRDGAHHVHEWYDGTGYPEHLKGEEIPEIARIIAVADHYDDLTSRKRDRDAYPQFVVREEFIKGAGTHFDPRFAGVMVGLIDDDKDYLLRESTEALDTSLEESIVCQEYRSRVTRGILIDDTTTKISFDWSLKSDSPTGFSTPSIILFDAYDGRIHEDEKSIKAFGYFELGEVWFSGHFNSNKARNMEVTVSQSEGGGEINLYNASFKIDAVRFEDHVKLSIVGEGEIIDVMVALPDSSNYVYIALTGEYCEISNIKVVNTDIKITAKDIERIAPTNNYINRLEGDLPNFQIERNRSATSSGVIIEDGLNCEFHTLTLPAANFIWQCPYVVIYYSDDGKVNGDNYLEYALIKMNGEAESDCPLVRNDIASIKTDKFIDWDDWKEKNKNGTECHISFRLGDRTLETATECSGVRSLNRTSFLAMPDHIYFALTGETCAITDIRTYK